MSMEAALVIGQNDEILYEHIPAGRSAGSLPDSRDLWDVLWEHRQVLAGVAHSHPGRGNPWPSGTDATTFDAVELGLGRPLTWWICTRDRCFALNLRDTSRTWVESIRAYDAIDQVRHDRYGVAPPWLFRLRELSYGTDNEQRLWLVGEHARRVVMTPPVDDDFPEVLHQLDSALKAAEVLRGDGSLFDLRNAVVKWRGTSYHDASFRVRADEVTRLLRENGFF